MMAHLAELRTSNIFAQFDYGDSKLNIQHYGEKYADYAPVIDLHQIAKSNEALFYARIFLLPSGFTHDTTKMLYLLLPKGSFRRSA